MMSDRPALLEVDNLVAGYGKMAVLHEVSLRVYPGELLSVVGPNGAGKSTLMHAIAGVISPLRGAIRFDGADVTSLDSVRLNRRGVGYVPQRSNVFPDLTVRENLEMGTLSVTNGQARLQAVYERFPVLARRQHQRAATLSGGERQMLAIGSAMLANPRLLILDEPTTGLAPKIVDTLIEAILEIRTGGTTLIWVVEENPRRVLSRVDRVYLLESGVIRTENTGTELLENPDFNRLFMGN